MNERLYQQLIKHEGFRKHPYKDSVGKLTIAVGRNLDDVGISYDEAMILLENDVYNAMNELDKDLSWWRAMNEPRQNVLVNMCFNLGISRLKGFKKALLGMQHQQWHMAATEMLDSKWAEQVGNRAKELAKQMRSGV